MPMKLQFNFIFLLLLVCLSPKINAQSLSLILPEMKVQEDELFDLSIEVKDFNQLVSLQFSIVWNSEVIEYISNDVMDLENVAIGNTKSSEGILRFSWFDIVGEGVTLEEKKKIVKFHFKAIGKTGDITNIKITDNPLPIQIYQGTGNDYHSIEADIDNGWVEIGSTFSFDAFVTELKCNGGQTGSISLNVPNEDSFSYSWAGDNGFIFNGKDINGLTAGSYHLIVLNDDNEVVLDSIFLLTEPSPIILSNISIVDGNCDGGVGSVDITPVGGTPPYTFDLGSGTFNTGFFSELEAGSYEVTVTDANGCDEYEGFDIINEGAPIVSLGENRKICEGSSLSIIAGDYTYSWSTGENSNSIIPSETGLYSVTVSTPNGCSATDEILVSLTEAPVAILESEKTTVCLGDSLQLSASGGDYYYWLDKYGFISDTTLENPVATPRFNAPIGLVAGNECSEDTLYFDLGVYDILATAGQDTCVRVGSTVNLKASGGIQYFWVKFDSNLSNNSIPNPETKPSKNSSYVVTILDENECITIDTVKIRVDCDPSIELVAVNTITPNGDGKNDNLEFIGLESFTPNKLIVFNRWGKIVYEAIDYQLSDDRFNGTFKGEILPSGVYYYVLSFGDQEIKQTLTIINE